MAGELTTKSGYRFTTTKTINNSWMPYDKSVAMTHLANWGVIILDAQYKTPIDDEYEAQECFETYERKVK